MAWYYKMRWSIISEHVSITLEIRPDLVFWPFKILNQELVKTLRAELFTWWKLHVLKRTSLTCSRGSISFLQLDTGPYVLCIWGISSDGDYDVPMTNMAAVWIICNDFCHITRCPANKRTRDNLNGQVNKWHWKIHAVKRACQLQNSTYERFPSFTDETIRGTLGLVVRMPFRPLMEVQCRCNLTK